MLDQSVDPGTQELLNNLLHYLMPILWAIAGAGAIFIGIRLGFKIFHDPENKAKYIKEFCWQVVGIAIIFVANTIGHILLSKYASLPSN